MRILLIGPHHHSGSLPPYLDILARGLQAHGAHVDRLGSTGPPYDAAAGRFWHPQRILAAAHSLLDSVDPSRYDLLSVHFGNLEIEQLLPVLLTDRPHPPAVYHVHSLDWTLFTRHVPEPALRAAVNAGVAAMNGFVLFGHYAQRKLAPVIGDRPAAIVWLPTTIDHIGPAAPRRTVIASHRPVLSLYGYAAPWKDVPTLLTALQGVPVSVQFLLTGPFWDQPDQAGVDLTTATTKPMRLGHVELHVVPTYYDSTARQALVDTTDLAVFPYQHHPTFQGSGAIADYLAHGVPILATDVANMRELVGDAGIVVPPQDPHALRDAITDWLVNVELRQRLAHAAARRAANFIPEHHATTCLGLYQTVLDQHPHGEPLWPQPNCSSPATEKPTATATRSSADP